MSVNVSICIPAYNQAALVRRTIASVLRQTYQDYEIIVTDDSTSDDIQALIENEFLRAGIRYFRNQPKKGSPANWNEAISKAMGNYIKIMHHDDWFAADDSLQLMVAALDGHPDIDLVFGATRVCDTSGKVLRIHAPVEQIRKLKDDPHLLFPKNYVGAPSATMFRRSVVPRFDERLKWVVDIEFYLAVLAGNPRFVYIEQPVVCTATGEHTVTASCQDDRDVELFEWLYLFDRLASRVKFSGAQLRFVRRLLYKYQVRSLADIKFPGLELTERCRALLKWMILFNRLKRAVCRS